MVRGLRAINSIFVLLLFAGTSTIFAQAGSANKTDEAAIRQIVQTVENGWNAHDGVMFASPFAADADYVVVNGGHVKGKSGIEKGHVAILTSIYKESTNKATIKSIRFLRPDVALVHIEWNMEIKPGTGISKAVNTMVVTKDAGKWSIASFHNTPIQAQGR